jgi:predicted Zn-dependent protease with MMP-like domain
MAYHVSKAEFASLVEKALSELPSPFAEFLEEVPVQIMDRPSRKLLRSLGMEADDLLLGLYQGADLADRVEAEGRGTPLPNHILIFQEDIEQVSESEADLVREVRTTVLHEIGHHFGMSEHDLDELGYG